MKIVLDSEQDFSVRILLSENDAQKSNMELIADLSTLCFSAVKAFMQENFAFDDKIEESEIVISVLETLIPLAKAYYDA